VIILETTQAIAIENKKVVGKFKDECYGRSITEFVGLRPKLYSILEFNGDNIKKAKGVQKTVVKEDLRHELYEQCLDEHKDMKRKQIVIRSRARRRGVYEQNKTRLSPRDTKKWIAADGITTMAFGHYPTAPGNVAAIEDFSTSCCVSENPIRRQLSARRHDQKLLLNESTSRPIVEVVQRGLTSLPDRIANRKVK